MSVPLVVHCASAGFDRQSAINATAANTNAVLCSPGLPFFVDDSSVVSAFVIFFMTSPYSDIPAHTLHTRKNVAMPPARRTPTKSLLFDR
jgi:hypothetical protein